VTHTHEPLLGLLDGRPLPRAELDRRLTALRAGPRASALPAAGTQQDRQLTRWVAQVLLTEELCAAEAAARGLDCAAAPPVHLNQRAAVELGSIAAAAFEGSAAVRAVYEAVTADVQVTDRPPTAEPPPTEWQLSTPDGDFTADPTTLPTELADALRAAGPGRPVTAGPWTATLVGPAPRTAAPDPAVELLDCARRIAFVRWLDQARATRLTLVPGLEHPGDPAQPDYDHRH
jgi:[acyl-carrier-protein] S-malonyltransferase